MQDLVHICTCTIYQELVSIYTLQHNLRRTCVMVTMYFLYLPCMCAFLQYFLGASGMCDCERLCQFATSKHSHSAGLHVHVYTLCEFNYIFVLHCTGAPGVN